MNPPTVLLCATALIGSILGFALWSFRVIPAWAILIGTVGVPFLVACAAVLILLLLTMDRGL